VPSELSFRVLNQVHRTIIRLTGGRLGWSAPGYGMPVVELTTTGRKTGEPRTTMLTSPLRQEDEIVLVASAGGSDRHPAWYLNLLADPEVTVTTREKRAQRMRAEPASEEERARLWPIIVRDHPNYAGYQRKTRREIPLVVLRPLGS